jgi:hypothetical protein
MINRLRNLSNMGIVFLMFFAMMVAGGIAIVYISSIALQASQQNEDLLNLFTLFNQSVVENRERAAENTQFQRTALQNIAEDQNQTEEFLPLLLQSFQDIAEVRNQTDDLENVTMLMQKATAEMLPLVTFLGDNFNKTMLLETYEEYATTEEMKATLDIVNQTLNRIERFLQSP